MATSFTEEQLDKLNAAIAAGALKVEYADKAVTYRSLADMLKLRELMLRELGISSGTAGRIYPDFDRGL